MLKLSISGADSKIFFSNPDIPVLILMRIIEALILNERCPEQLWLLFLNLVTKTMLFDQQQVLSALSLARTHCRSQARGNSLHNGNENSASRPTGNRNTGRGRNFSLPSGNGTCSSLRDGNRRKSGLRTCNSDWHLYKDGTRSPYEDEINCRLLRGGRKSWCPLVQEDGINRRAEARNSGIFNENERNSAHLCGDEKNSELSCKEVQNSELLCKEDKNSELLYGNEKIHGDEKNSELPCEDEKNSELPCKEDKISELPFRDDQNSELPYGNEKISDLFCKDGKNCDVSLLREDTRQPGQEHQLLDTANR